MMIDQTRLNSGIRFKNTMPGAISRFRLRTRFMVRMSEHRNRIWIGTRTHSAMPKSG